MRRLSVVSLVFAVGALSCVAAQAQTSTKTKTHPSRVQAAAEQAQIVVTKRSFLDSGNVVPVGTTHRYMDGGTVYANSPGNTYRKDLFGDWLFPGAFGLPGFVPR